VSLQEPTSAELFSLRLTSLSYADVSEAVNRHLVDPPTSTALIVDATNTMGMAASCQDDRLRQSMSTYDYLLPDGMPLVWAMRRRKAAVRSTTAGPHLVQAVLGGRGQLTNITLVGGFPNEHERIIAASAKLFPNARFTLMHNAPKGQIDEAYVASVVRLVEESEARLIFVCLGVPRQYYFAALARPLIGDRVLLSVGGAFLYLIGDAKVPPVWMQRCGLWWLHRMLRNPRRLASRYARYNTMFVYYYARRELTGAGHRTREGSV